MAKYLDKEGLETYEATVKGRLQNKQDKLESGTNIKTINNTSLLGSGNITAITSETDPVFTASAAHGITSTDISNWNGKQDALVSGTSIKTINSSSILGSGDVALSTATNLENGTGTSSLKTTGAYSASGNYSFAEGRNAIASGSWSHAEGTGSNASGDGSHAEGMGSTSSGFCSHAEGGTTTAASDYQHVEGTFNIVDSNDTYIHIAGNGDDNNNRSNAYTLDWSGNGVYAGKVTVGSAPTNNMDVTTKQYVDTKDGDLTTLTTTDKTDLVSAINEVNSNIPTTSSLVDLIYPVGSIYTSTNSTSPATLFGGTWTQLEDRFLLGAGTSYTAGATGGAATVTLTTDQIPGHTHIAAGYRESYAGSGTARNTPVSWNSSSRSGQYTSSSTGGGQAHNNMPPYLVVYMWERTA